MTAPDQRPIAATSRVVVPSYFDGVGGYSKIVLPRLDALFHQHFNGARPEVLPFSLFDFDEALAEVIVNGSTYSIAPYLKVLPKQVLLDLARKLKRKNRQALAFMERYRDHVHVDAVRAVDAPGLNLFVQAGNLAWRLVWESHVLPELQTKRHHLNPAPNTLERLSRSGIVVASRSVIWVIAGGASTTGPTGLIPMLCELKRLKPAQTSLFCIVFTPRSYRDNTSRRQVKGRAIFRATMEQLCTIFDGEREFNQPYGLDGYRIELDEPPFDQLFLVDGSFGGDRREFETKELADLVALFLFKCTVGPLGERMLGIIGDLNRPTAGDSHE